MDPGIDALRLRLQPISDRRLREVGNTVFEQVVTRIDELPLPGDLGGWASILALFLSLLVMLYTVVRIASVRKFIEQDRQLMQNVVSLPEAYHTLQEVKAYVRGNSEGGLSRGTDARDDAIEKLAVAANAIESYYALAFRINIMGGNALACAGRHFKRNGKIGAAIFCYERAIALAEINGSLDSHDLRECIEELQRCYLVTWQPVAAGRLARRQAGADLDLIPEERIKRVGAVVCLRYSLGFLAGDAVRTISRQKSRIHTIGQLK